MLFRTRSSCLSKRIWSDTSGFNVAGQGRLILIDPSILDNASDCQNFQKKWRGSDVVRQ